MQPSKDMSWPEPPTEGPSLQPTKKPVPQALYCCGHSECCEEQTWPASDLWWSENKQGWFCTYCWDGDDVDLLEEDKGESLAEYLATGELT